MNKRDKCDCLLIRIGFLVFVAACAGALAFVNVLAVERGPWWAIWSTGIVTLTIVALFVRWAWRTWIEVTWADVVCWLLGHRKPSDCRNAERCYFCARHCPRCGRYGMRPRRPWWVSEALDTDCPEKLQ